MDDLNKQQLEAVIYQKGPLLVLAGAGSGKTKVLTHRVAYFIEKGLTKAENCLLLTFTNKASDEMKQRISRLISTKTDSLGGIGFGGTFHSFCAKVLRLDGKYIDIPTGFIIYDDTDQKDLIKEILKELNLENEKINPSSLLSGISEIKNQMISPQDYLNMAHGSWQELSAKVYLEYEKRLKNNGALDFDDLLIKTVELFLKSKEVLNKWQKQFTHIFVDEWQDTNKIQYVLTKLMVGKNENLTVVGDAAQSIYSWRGADYRNINNLIKDYPKIKVINLEQNYRSTQNILDAANNVISKNTKHPVLKLWTEKGQGNKVKLYEARNGFDEVDFVIKEIDKLIKKSEGFSYHDIAILYRTNAQSRALEEGFIHAGVPYTLVGGTRFYDRKEIKDLLAYVKVLVNPKDSVSQKRIEKIGVRRMQKFNELTLRPNEKTIDVLDKIIQKTYYVDLFNKDTEEDLQRKENIKELRSVAEAFPEINTFLEQVALVEAGSKRSRSKNSGDAVTLMTLHSAKGLEFPVVFIVGMEEGIFPHSRSLMDNAQMEEERRLAYVGITRAKEKLYLTYATNRIFFAQV